MKEKLVLVSDEVGKHCDIFPSDSIHLVTEENKGTYKVPFQNNNYVNMEWVKDHNYTGKIGDTCIQCKNAFKKSVKLVDNICPRCVDRKTRVN